MSDIALPRTAPASDRPKLDHPVSPKAIWGFLAIIAGCALFVAYSIYVDVDATGARVSNYPPYILLGVALVIALGFEFVNGFSDTANAVAKVIYTHSLPANFAVVWSGAFNFLGVLFSTGAVAFGIISPLPVELILQVGSSAGFAMVFALLIAAIIWNLRTWWLGLPASSSHTLIGSIIGVGVTNALLLGRDGTSGVDWDQAHSIGKTLLISPTVGFACSAILLLVIKALIRNPQLYEAPKGAGTPPWWIRGLLVFTCTGVSFAHGSNDGQKGMGLAMLILIGTVPTAYALNRALPQSQIASFHSASADAAAVIAGKAAGYNVICNPRPAVTNYISTHQISGGTYPSLSALVTDIARQIDDYGSFTEIPATQVGKKIGKTRLTHGQGAAAEFVAMGTIFAADNYGLPVSTTHVLSSGVAGSMAANGSGIQMQTVRNLVLAWVLTPPAAAMTSGGLYFLFSKLF